MSKYKIIIRNSPGWRTFEACTLGVSVTSPNWQDEHFASILDFAAEHFKTIRIDVTDLLYRHNFMAEGLSSAEAQAQASALGALWLARHQSIIDACAVRPEVIRWGQWYDHPEYPSVLDGFYQAYARSPALRAAIESDIEGFFCRQQRTPTEIDRQHSRDYLIEELAVATLQSRSLVSLKLYPGDDLLCLEAVRRGMIPEAPRGLEREQFSKIRFHTRGVSAAKELCARQALCPTVRVPTPPASLLVLNS
jgi:tRNA-dependent cyclodipeptide synthase